MLRIGTRGSALALAQAGRVRDRLTDLGEEAELVVIRTSGDETQPAPETVDKERFVKEIDDALLDERIDLAVHSAKDVPGDLPDGLAIVGVAEREDPRDALCGFDSLDDLPEGAVVGTASLRRRSQLLAARPDLRITEVRGNVDTRLRKLAAGEADALVLATAGLRRLGRDEGTPIPCKRMTPAPGQGCLALEGRVGDSRAAELGERLSVAEGVMALTAERALVSVLEATCHTPVGAFAREREGRLRITGWAGKPDGSEWVTDTVDGHLAEPAAVGTEVAERMIAAGANEVLGR